MRPLTRATVTLRFNVGFYGCLAVVLLAVLLLFGSSRVIALSTAAGLLLVWMLILWWMRSAPPKLRSNPPLPRPRERHLRRDASTLFGSRERRF